MLRSIAVAALTALLVHSAALRAGTFASGPKLVGAGAVGGSAQGSSVALSSDGSTALVGGEYDDPTGATWVFTRIAGPWKQQGDKLVGAGAVGGSAQGSSVALSADGSTALIGGFLDNSLVGAVWVFTRSGGLWTQQGDKLVGTGAAGAAKQGLSVALSSDGNTALVGGDGDDSNVGAAWIFTRSGGVWTQQGGKLVGTGAVGAAMQGSSVALSSDGSTALVGGYGDNSFAGATWVFTRSGGVWTQQGNKLVGTGGVAQGQSVALSSDGNLALVGGSGVWAFTRSGGTWTEASAPGTAAGIVALSSDGSTALVSAAAFTRSGSSWTPLGGPLVWTAADGYYGQDSGALSGDGNTAILGVKFDHGGLAAGVGAAWIFPRFRARGDANADGVVNVTDVFYLINFLFAGGPAPK